MNSLIKYVTYKYYNEHGNRLTIVYTTENQLIITPCSKKDNFNKKLGLLYCLSEESFKSVLKLNNITIKSQKEFIDFCDKTFYRLENRYYSINGIQSIKMNKNHKLKNNVVASILYKK